MFVRVFLAPTPNLVANRKHCGYEETKQKIRKCSVIFTRVYKNRLSNHKTQKENDINEEVKTNKHDSLVCSLIHTYCAFCHTMSRYETKSEKNDIHKE